jgi:hypothetical protein
MDMRRDAKRSNVEIATAAGGSMMARGKVFMSRAVMAELAASMHGMIAVERDSG